MGSAGPLAEHLGDDRSDQYHEGRDRSPLIPFPHLSIRNPHKQASEEVAELPALPHQPQGSCLGLGTKAKAKICQAVEHGS